MESTSQDNLLLFFIFFLSQYVNIVTKDIIEFCSGSVSITCKKRGGIGEEAEIKYF